MTPEELLNTPRDQLSIVDLNPQTVVERNIDCVNCKGTTFSAFCVDCTKCTRCADCIECIDCKDCVGCIVGTSLDKCVDCTYSTNCVGCLICSDCINCTNCEYCIRCIDCIDCIDCADCNDCVGIKNGKSIKLQYVAYGVQLTEEQYKEFIEKNFKDDLKNANLIEPEAATIQGIK